MQIVLQAHGGKLSDSWMNNLQKGLNDCMSTIKDAVRVVEFIDTVADAIGEQLIENRFIQLMSIYRSKKSKGELYKHAICKAQIIVSYVKGSTYFT